MTIDTSDAWIPRFNEGAISHCAIDPSGGLNSCSDVLPAGTMQYPFGTTIAGGRGGDEGALSGQDGLGERTRPDRSLQSIRARCRSREKGIDAGLGDPAMRPMPFG